MFELDEEKVEEIEQVQKEIVIEEHIEVVEQQHIHTQGTTPDSDIISVPPPPETPSSLEEATPPPPPPPVHMFIVDMESGQNVTSSPPRDCDTNPLRGPDITVRGIPIHHQQQEQSAYIEIHRNRLSTVTRDSNSGAPSGSGTPRKRKRAGHLRVASQSSMISYSGPGLSQSMDSYDNLCRHHSDTLMEIILGHRSRQASSQQNRTPVSSLGIASSLRNQLLQDIANRTSSGATGAAPFRPAGGPWHNRQESTGGVSIASSGTGSRWREFTPSNPRGRRYSDS